MSDYDPIETAVIEAFRILLVRAKQGGWPPVQWTPEVKNTLRAVGLDMNYEVRGTGIDRSTQVRYREWLYDMVWCSIQDGCLIDVHLIMECEWNPAKYEIDKDFQRLLVGRAPHRVMIFEKNTR